MIPECSNAPGTVKFLEFDIFGPKWVVGLGRWSAAIGGGCELFTPPVSAGIAAMHVTTNSQ